MPLRLNVGVTKKLGLPEYSSVGASCNLELELDSSLLEDPEALHERVRDAYVACHQAVHDELARLRGRADPPAEVPTTSPNGHAPVEGKPARANGAPARSGGSRARPTRAATPGQAKAIHAIARAQHADLEGLLRDEYGVGRPEDLSLAEASKLIDQLKAASAV